VIAIAMGIACAVWSEAIQGEQEQEEDASFIRPATLMSAFFPILLWQAITLTAWRDLLAGAFLYYHLVSLPLATLVFDLFATHAVHWMTASSTSDHASMGLGRRAWALRLFGLSRENAQYASQPNVDFSPDMGEAIRAVRSYRWGAFWLVGAALIPLSYITIVCGHTTSTTLGLQLVAGTMFGLLGAVILRSGGDLYIVPQFFRMLAHWFYYGWKERLPPWVHHSPCGGWLGRQWYVLVVVGILAVPLTSMTAHSCSRLLVSANKRPTTTRAVQPTTDDGARHLSLLSAAEQVATSPWLPFAPTVLVALTIPAINFCLIGLLLTGNLISAYHDAFEASLGVPPPPVFPDEEKGNQTTACEGRPS